MKEKKEIFSVMGTLTLQMIIIQVVRLTAKQVVFRLVQHTDVLGTVVSVLTLFIAMEAIIIYCRIKDIDLDFWPKRYDTMILTMGTICGFMLGTAFVIVIVDKCYSTMGMTILYYSVVLVLFEEIFFRGYAFKRIEDNSSIAQAILITAAMNASWYLGFFDDRGILHLFGNLYSDMGLLTLIRMLVGLIAGLVLGLIRWKSSNILMPALIHATIYYFISGVY